MKEVRMFNNTRDQYGLISRLLHWLVFALVSGMLIGGFMLHFLPSGGIKAVVLSVHKSIGLVILLLMLTRLLWRCYTPQPRDLGENLMLNYIAHVLHVCLYVLLLLQPVAGILMSQAHGYPVTFFGIIELPSIILQSPMMATFFREVHGVIAVLLTVSIAVHAGAALKHHFIDRDRTLMRMIKGR